MKFGPKVLLPLIVLAVGLLGTTALIVARPAVEPKHPTPHTPLVRVVRVNPAPAQLRVQAQGTVEPRTEGDLVAESAGRIVWESPQLEDGAFFHKGEVLARLEPADYENAAERARASVERADSQLALAKVTLRRRRSLRSAGASSKAAFDEAHSNARIAEANLRDARAVLRQALLDLQRTKIRAPFEGRVRAKHLDVGQYVGPGAKLARVYAVDYAEIRLPIPSEDLAFLDLGWSYSEGRPTASQTSGKGVPPVPHGPKVELSGDFAGRHHTWSGRIVRTDGALDPHTRMLNAVARVAAPYARGDDPTRPPLSVGLFVTAQIEGRVFEGVYELPRSALRGRDELAVVDAESRIFTRHVEVLRAEGDTAWVSAGLAPGERVCITPVDVLVEGMPVRIAPDPRAEVASPIGPAGPARVGKPS